MQIDKFTKFLLAIIAVNLTLNTFKNLSISTHAFANQPKNNVQSSYGLVPINADGTVPVSISETATMDVRLVDIYTSDRLNVNLEDINTSDKLNITIADINTSDELEVNITEVGSQTIYSKIPVTIVN